MPLFYKPVKSTIANKDGEKLWIVIYENDHAM